MAEVMTVLGALGTKLMAAAAASGSFLAANAGTISAIGSGVGAAGTIYAAQAANSQAKDEARALKQKGDNELAVGQREAMRRRRETNLVLSRQKAVAAASGGGASDPTVEAVMGKTQEEGDYNAMIDMYNGARNRADLYNEAKTAKKEGKLGVVNSYFETGRSIYSDFAASRRKGYSGSDIYSIS